MVFRAVVSLFAIISHLVVLCSTCDTLVTAKSGKYLGIESATGNVFKFLGIPYANPPVGKLRFKPSQLIPPHVGVFEATRHGTVCPQLEVDLGEKFNFLALNFTQSEDCLVLDIYVPKAALTEKQKAVLVWIHGGGYTIGTGNTYDASLLAGFNDIIVVSINYRLGILGFMTTLDEHAAGNYGIWDQITALKWVNENIESFGGDKTRITVGGESAGAGSVTQLSLAPVAQGLFHRVIAQSGSPLAPWSSAPHPVRNAKAVAANVGCPDDDSKALVECLREVPFEKLVLEQIIDLRSAEAKWSPVYNNELFPFTMTDLLNNWTNISVGRQLSEVDLLVGVCSEEGALFYDIMWAMFKTQIASHSEGNGQVGPPISPSALFGGLLVKMLETVLPAAASMPEVFIPVIQYKYTDWTNPHDEIAQANMFVQFFGDTMFNVAAYKFANMHSELVKILDVTGSSSPPRKTFYYRYNQPGSWMESKPWRTGADHGDDVFFLFGHTLSDSTNSTLEEKIFTQKMMKYWTNFVKTGDPNKPVTSDIDLPTWPAYNSDSQKFIELDTSLSANSVKTRMFSESMAFWTEFLPHQIKTISEIKAQCSQAGSP